MITWIASYPKSGNTWMKLFLKSYFNFGNTSFSINSKINDHFSIETFPVTNKFKMLNIDYKNFADIAKNWVNMQSLINLNNKTNYIKTHNAMCSINNYNFTNNENTLAAIYIVRDPRDIAISYSSFLGLKLDDTIDFMLSPLCYEEDIFENVKYKKSIMGNWAYHYNSWKSYKSRKVIIIKYEDMLSDPNKTFLQVLRFLNKIDNIKIDKQKMSEAVTQTSFKNLQKLEFEEGFDENPSNRPFFREGRKGEWKQKLSSENIKKIETKFFKEMKELGYL
tara:strand:+ start:220 stop:1053 length:834 start_codon:yes stop_codon:yes gene_type:complete